MEFTEREKRDEMGEFHNKIVGLVNETNLSVAETILVLHMVADTIENLFKTAALADRKENTDGCDVEENSVPG